MATPLPSIKEIDELLFADQNGKALLAVDRVLNPHNIEAHQMGLTTRRIQALMGLGRIEEAQKTIGKTLNQMDSNQTMLDKACFEIVWANLLVTTNQVSEALVHYENALIPLKQSHGKWFQFGRIWRELALAYFGDLRSIEHLSQLRLKMMEQNKTDLADLATCFLAEAMHHFHQTISNDDIEAYRAIRLPGLRLQALAVSGTKLSNQEIIDFCSQLQGVKGYPWVLSEVIPLDGIGGDWLNQYVLPIVSLRAKNINGLFPDLPETPYLRSTACQNCDGRCCYDGVYVTAPEEAAIDAFMKRYPTYFIDIPKAYLENGEWGFVFHGKRTKRRNHAYTRLDYPAHFQRVKCVLALPNGECSLQRAASDELYHPWKYKPEICWEFPLIGLFNDDALTHPHYFGQTDPAYIDDKRPGYLSFLPCSRVYEDGVSWKSVYQNELQYFFYIKNLK